MNVSLWMSSEKKHILIQHSQRNGHTAKPEQNVATKQSSLPEHISGNM